MHILSVYKCISFFGFAILSNFAIFDVFEEEFSDI